MWTSSAMAASARRRIPHLTHSGASRFELRLPFGGDANPDTRVASVRARATLTLFPGLLVNPSIGGRYLPTAAIVTVDPDTGGDDDGLGEAPVASVHQLVLDIAGPRIVPFARLSIDALYLEQDGRERYRFLVGGRYLSGRASTGFDPRSDDVTVTIEWIRPGPSGCRGHGCGHGSVDRHALLARPVRAFSQTVSGSAFDRFGPLHHFKGEAPGIEQFWLGPTASSTSISRI